jgi:hypothetical protein
LNFRPSFGSGNGVPADAIPDAAATVRWLLVEGRTDGTIEYALSNLPSDTTLQQAVALRKGRWHVQRGYEQLKQELGWADFMVRADQAIRRHWHLVFCAFSFCWRAWFTTGPPPATTEPAAPADSDARSASERGKIGPGRSGPARPVSWPRTLRQVRGWLDPWTFLWHCWHAWSNARPPPELRALLDAVGQGHPLDLYLRS